MDSAVFPEEIWIQILLYCDVPDIIAFGNTCKSLRKTSNNDYLWRMKWLQLILKVNFRFPDIKSLQLLGVNFKSMCYRLHTLSISGKSIPRCDDCGGYTCLRNCIEGYSPKVVLEIGNKYTSIMAPGIGLRTHYSMFCIPRCKKKTDIGQVENESNGSSGTLWKSQTKEISNRSRCVLCNPIISTKTKHSLRTDSIETSCYSVSDPIYEKLVNGYCREAVEIYGISNADIISPAEALLNNGTFSVLKSFIDHLIDSPILTSTLRNPNGVLMFCEPLHMNPVVRKQLLHYLFQEVQVARVCLVPKPLAVCAMLDVETCIVVDSGALSTTVAVVIGGRVIARRWKVVPVGGWHVAYHLKQAMDWQSKEYHRIPISYLDERTVKTKCRLFFDQSYQRLQGTNYKKRVYLPPYTYTSLDESSYLRVDFGLEIFNAPLMMYVSLDLPQVIKEVTTGLSEEIMHDCLSHILLTGGNSDLKGFIFRLTRDLKELFPEYSMILDVESCSDMCNSTVMGTTCVSLPEHPDNTPPEYTEGNSFWLSREEYILFGCKSLER